MRAGLCADKMGLGKTIFDHKIDSADRRVTDDPNFIRRQEIDEEDPIPKIPVTVYG